MTTSSTETPQVTTRKAPLTGIVVSFNEADLLERCLPALTFCEELIVVNMECTDRTPEVAAKYGARVIKHHRVPTVELVLEFAASHATHDWVLSVDPDEVMDKKLADQITALLASEEIATIGRVELPWQFYFGSHALKGTYWGGEGYKRGTMFHRGRVTHIQQVHHRPLPKEGFTSHQIKWEGDNVLHHYWMTNYAMFIEKHLRYIKLEGSRRNHAGQTFSWWSTVKDTVVSFGWSLLRRKGYRDGLVGVGLSGLYAWYVGSSWLSLRKFEQKMRDTSATTPK